MRRLFWTRVSLALVVGCSDSPRPAPSDIAVTGLELVSSFALDDGTITSASLIEDSRIVVTAQPNVLAVYDSLGNRQATIGREGSGPGEFRMLTWATPAGTDSIWAFDFVRRRLTLFRSDGTYLDSWRVQGATTPNVVARLAAGPVVLVDPFMPMPSRQAGVSVDTVDVLLLSAGTDAPTRAARIPWSTRFQSSESVGFIPQPLGSEASIAAGDSSFVVAFGNSAEVTEYDATGRVLSRRVLDISPRAASSEELAWARALADRPSRLEGIAELRRAVPLPDTVPLITGLRRDDDLLWAETFQVSDTVPRTWYAFSEAGARVDSLTLPAGADLLDIRASYVVLRVTLTSGEESVALYRRLPSGSTRQQ